MPENPTMQLNTSMFVVVFVVALVALGGPVLLWNHLVKKLVRPAPSDAVLALLDEEKRIDAVQLYMSEAGVGKEVAIDVLQKAEQERAAGTV